MIRSTLVLATAAFGALALLGCASPPSGDPGGSDALEPGQLRLDGAIYSLEGSCTMTDIGIVAEYEGLSTDSVHFTMLRFTGESSDVPASRATLSLDLAQGLIAHEWDGTTAHFDSSLQVTVGQGVLSGSGVYLDPNSGQRKNLEFLLDCPGVSPMTG